MKERTPVLQKNESIGPEKTSSMPASAKLVGHEKFPRIAGFIDRKAARVKEWYENPARVAQEAQLDADQIFEHTWDPRKYQEMFYRTIEPDELVTVKNNVVVVQDEITRREKLGLESEECPVLFLGGWTVKDLLPFAEVATEIHVTDFLDSNTDELNKWIRKEPDAWDWSQFTRYTIQCERNAKDPFSVPVSDDEVEAREELLRDKIRLVQAGVDLKKSDPFIEESKGKYPIVYSPYTADSATKFKTVWWAMMDKIMSTVAEDGLLMTAALRNCQEYTVDDNSDGVTKTMKFPGANINESDMKWRLRTGDFQPDSISVKAVKKGLEGHGYEGIILAHARRKGQALAA